MSKITNSGDDEEVLCEDTYLEDNLNESNDDIENNEEINNSEYIIGNEDTLNGENIKNVKSDGIETIVLEVSGIDEIGNESLDGLDKSIDEKENDKISKKKLSKVKKIGIGILSFLLVCVIGLTSGYYYVRSKIYTPSEPIKKIEITSNNTEADKSDFEEVKGITNILLIGADGRGDDDTPKSDSIIIATLDNNNKKIKLTSLYRDTLVNIPGYGQQRINASYELGGVNLLSDTIKQTYDIKIDKYLTIDFKGFEAIIDQIGGVEVEVKDYQLKELNKYIGESTGGNDCPVTNLGIQTLNGKQALSYSRIRKGVVDDYERTERQREVLVKVAEKLKKTNPTKYLGIMKSMLNYIDMNFEPIEALNMAYTIYKFPTLDTEQISIPVQDITVDKDIDGLGSVLIMDKYENTKILHEFIYEDKKQVANKLQERPGN